MHRKTENDIKKTPKIVCACFDLKKAKTLGFFSVVSAIVFLLVSLLAIAMYCVKYPN